MGCCTENIVVFPSSGKTGEAGDTGDIGITGDDGLAGADGLIGGQEARQQQKIVVNWVNT